MSKARETLDELLARGEISADEYDSRAAKLGAVEDGARAKRRQSRNKLVDRIASGMGRFWLTIFVISVMVVGANEAAHAWYFNDAWAEDQLAVCMQSQPASACLCLGAFYTDQSFFERFPMWSLYDMLIWEFGDVTNPRTQRAAAVCLR